MTKFTAELSNGRTLIGLGLSAGNVQRLKEGKPIHVDFSELNLPWNGALMIHYGESEQTLETELKQFIGPNTIVHRDIERKRQ